MKLIKKVVPANFNIFLCGDVHTGTIMHYRKGWDKLVDMVLSPYEGVQPRNNFVVDHGDIVEAIMLDDFRFRPEEGITSPMMQMLDAIAIRMPIKKQIVTILEGNHPLKLWKFGPITQMVCEGYKSFTGEGTVPGLGTEYGTYTCKVSWVDRKGELLFKSFHTHGRKGIMSQADDPIRQLANWKLKLKKDLKEKAGDCMIMCKGHTHKLLISEPKKRLYLTDDGSDINQQYTEADHTAAYIHPDLRWYCNTGSFLKLYAEMGISGYAEIAEYDPIELGFVIAKVRDRKIVGVDKIVL